MDLQNLLNQTIERSASDLHIVSGYYPSIRIQGELIQLRTHSIIDGKMAEDMLFSIINDKQKELFTLNRELDFGLNFGEHRFRVNLYYSLGQISASFRLIPKEIRSIEDLGLLPVIGTFADLRQGFILVTGPTGQGKSTTLASIVNQINYRWSKHIITVEDPIEYIYPKANSIISQREIARDTYSWPNALKAALREDPDVALIGEMRDYDTVAAALTIAETGHLVFSSLHTNSAAETINRIVDIFPSNQQNQVRIQLASTLKAIVSQRLVPNIQGAGERIVACEILINNPAISAIIREGKMHLIDNVIETSSADGMILMEKHLYNLFIQKKISKESAYYFAIRPDQIKKMIG